MTATRMPPLPDPNQSYATLAQLKSSLNISDDSGDDSLTDLLVTASGLVDGYAGRPLALASWSQTFRFEGYRGTLILSRYPIVSVIGVNIGGVDVTDCEHTVDFDAWAGLLYRTIDGCRWHCHGEGRHRRITVQYQAGYVLPGTTNADGEALIATLPKAIAQATLITARALYYAPRRGDPMVRSEATQGVGSVSFLDPDTSTGGLPPDAAAMLDSCLGARSGIG